MGRCNPCKKFDVSILSIKVFGLMALAFCCGTIIGLFLPVAVIAILETALLLMLAYMCLFQW